MIREGTQAAKDVSKFDLELRQERERYKRRLLKNLHTFVSSVRLCVHNIPPQLSDGELREIFLKNSPQGAKITEVINFFTCVNVGKCNDILF